MRDGSIWTIAVIACVLAAGLAGANVAWGNAAEPAVQNTTATMDPGTNSTLSLAVYEVTDNETIYNSSGTKLTAGTDYTWYPTTQNVSWQSSPNVTAGETATVRLAVRTHDDTEQATGDILSTAGSWIGFLLLFAVVGWLINVALGDF
jgi:hypothetical protein